LLTDGGEVSCHLTPRNISWYSGHERRHFILSETTYVSKKWEGNNILKNIFHEYVLCRFIVPDCGDIALDKSVN
jgi:hypothetical protein